MKMDNEDDIIKRAQKGDARAFEQLMAHYYDVIYAFAYKSCGRVADAEDITQNACIKLARSLDQFQGKSAFSSWLYRLVINCAKDWFKSQSRHPENPDALENVKTNADGEDAVYNREILTAISALPEGEREAILLVHAEGLSHKEAGYILGCKESTISWRIHEARKKLSAQFGKGQHYG